MVKKYGNFIKSEWISSWGHEGKFPSINPANVDETIGEFVISDEADVNHAVAAAMEAAPDWKATSGPERAKVLQKAVNEVLDHKEELARFMTKEMGKPIGESLGETQKSIEESQFMIGEGYRLYGTTVPSEKANTWSQTVRVPIGPVAAITPWNFPILTPMRKIMPALITGNPMVMKPSEFTPLTTLRLIELLSKHLPSGLLNGITGKGQTGEDLVNHPDIKAVTFTGSTSTGRKIYSMAAQRLVRVQAEMGGKNPVVIWDPENLEDAAQQIAGAALQCSGQRCTAISRVIVPREDADKVEQALLNVAEKYQPGDGMEENVNLGPLYSQDHLEKVKNLVNQAVQQGARLICGGKPLQESPYSNGYFYPVTLLSDVTADMNIAREEVFGPVLSIQPVDTFEEALTMANDVDYGLSSAIFTQRLDLAGRFTDGIESGMVHVNHGTAPEVHMPFGGMKDSQVNQGSVGFTTKDFFTTVKSVYIKYAQNEN